jgi:predicted transcriptional regulator
MMRRRIVDSLSLAQRSRFDELRSDHQSEGFLVIHAFAGAAVHKRDNNFEISQSSLADRLSVTPPGAADVIRKLRELKVVERTQHAVRHKSAARFRWLL